MAWMKPLVKSGWLATDALIPLVLGNGITDGGGGEPTPPPINWKTVIGSSPLALVNALAHEIRSLTQYGKCTQASTPTPSAPVDIVCNNGALKWDSVNQRVYADGTPETLTVSGGNLFDKVTMGDRYLVSLYTENKLKIQTSNTGFIIPIEPSTTYTLSTSADLTIFRIATYDRKITAEDGEVKPNNYRRTTTNAPITFTTTATDHYLYVQVNSLLFDDVKETLQLEYGTTATAYKPYVAPQTITNLPMLLSVGDYADEAEIISGLLTHKVGIKVFDGSEEWIDGSNGYITEAVQDQSGDTYTPVCTHFRGTNTAPPKNSGTVRVYRTSGGTGRVYFAPNMTTYPTKEDFAAWLADQYASGTPVIVFFVLAEETTEQTTPHSLNSYEGTTVVDAQTNVDPVTLSVEYATSEE